MQIDISAKINEYLKKIEETNIYDEMEIRGYNNIKQYLKRFSNANHILNYSDTMVDRINIKAFEKFEVLKATSDSSEIIMISKDNVVIFKTIQINGIPTYTTSWNGIILNEEKKDHFRDIDVYFNEEWVMRNHVLYNDNIIAEKYLHNFNHNCVWKDKSINIIYENNLPSKIEVKVDQFNITLLSSYIADSVGIDINIQSGRNMFITHLRSNIDVLLGELDKQIFETKNHSKRK